MKIVKLSAVPMSAPVPTEKRHRTDLGTKVKSDATLIRVETDGGLIGIGAALGSPPIAAAIVAHELAPEVVGEDPMFSERIYEKMYNGSRSTPALARGIAQADESRRRGVIMEAIAGVDIAVWDVKAQALGVPLYQALGAVRSSVRGYASGGWAPGDAAEAELAGYAAKGFTAAKMRVVGHDGFSIAKCVRRVKAARRGLGPAVELMVDAHGSLEVSTAIKLARELEPYDIAWFEAPVSPDDHAGQAEVRRSTTIPIASGEREFTRFDFQDLLERRALDIAQPDVARAGGMTEIRHCGADLGARRAPCAACLGQRGAVCGEHSRGHGGRQLPHPRGDARLHADDVGALQRAVRHSPGRHRACPGPAGPRLYAARGCAGAVPVCRWAGVRVLATRRSAVRRVASLRAMRLPRRQFLRLAAGATALPTVAYMAWAQAYPARPIRLIVPFGSSGATDITARIIGQWLSERLGQQFVVENRPGAGGNLGTEAVVRAPADGYTLGLFGTPNAINVTLYEKLNFSFVRDIAPIASVVRFPNLMVVNSSLPATTVPQFIAYAKANPGKINMASPGTGSTPHLNGELFKAMTGIDMVHVPYRSVAAALTDLLSGRVHVFFGTTASSIGYVKSGTVRALAVTTAMRLEGLPDIPTIAEFVPGYEASAWFGLGAPNGTPVDIVEELNKEVNAGLGDSQVRARFADLGGVAMPGSPGDFGKLIAEETEKWAKVVKLSGIRAD
jgi:tripartite-type tricarboxylate transporter receptor subunit TctC/L-alanine-DL-glutamate epimerase-like enolase superfamily enzyme